MHDAQAKALSDAASQFDKDAKTVTNDETTKGDQLKGQSDSNHWNGAELEMERGDKAANAGTGSDSSTAASAASRPTPTNNSDPLSQLASLQADATLGGNGNREAENTRVTGTTAGHLQNELADLAASENGKGAKGENGRGISGGGSADANPSDHSSSFLAGLEAQTKNGGLLAKGILETESQSGQGNKANSLNAGLPNVSEHSLGNPKAGAGSSSKMLSLGGAGPASGTLRGLFSLSGLNSLFHSTTGFLLLILGALALVVGSRRRNQ